MALVIVAVLVAIVAVEIGPKLAQTSARNNATTLSTRVAIKSATSQPKVKKRQIIVPPTIARPRALKPVNGAHFERLVQLCWSRIAHATGYYVWIRGQATHMVASSCTALSLRSGQFSWRVAAYVRGSGVAVGHTFIGPYSTPARFVIGSAAGRAVHPKRKHASKTTQVHATAVPRIQSPLVQPSVAPVQPRPSVQPVIPPAPVVHAPTQQAVPVPQPVPHPALPTPAPAPVQKAPSPSGSTGCIPMYTC